MFNLLHHTPEEIVARLTPENIVFPKDCDAVVIGGGIVGTASAYYLAKQGIKTVLIERGRLASQQSGRNWGFVRTQYRDPLELPLAVQALSIWPHLETELKEPTGWRRNGCIFVSETPVEQGKFSDWQQATQDFGTGARLLSAREVSDLLPALQLRTEGALYSPSDGQAEPTLATIAFARAAKRNDVRIIEDCGALSIETSAGRVSGVQTEYGLIHCGLVVCAAGAHTHRLLSPLGLALPQQTVRSTVSLTEPLPPISQACFCGYGIGLRQRPDGSCIIAADSTSDIDLSLDSLRAIKLFLPELIRYRKGFHVTLGWNFFEDLLQRLSSPNAARGGSLDHMPANLKQAAETGKRTGRLFGVAEGIKIVKSWAGRIDVMPDALPILDSPAKIGGLIVATGFSGHGFGLGPAVGQQVAELAAGTKHKILEPFRADRFERGAYSRPHAPL